MEVFMFDHVKAFHQPRTVQKAVTLLQKKKGKACLVAGGTDLVLRAGRSVTDLVDITRLGLDYIRGNVKGMRIGAATTLAAIEHSSDVQRWANGILAKAAAACGTVQMRNARKAESLIVGKVVDAQLIEQAAEAAFDLHAL
jgi:CO/xanthine dehydrogenase FAD-binding subunit